MQINGFVCLVAIFFGILASIWWTKFTPRGFVYWMGALACALLIVTTADKSTTPSSAPRKSITGQLAWIVRHGYGKGSYYTFGVVLPSGATVDLKAAVKVPLFAKGESVSVTYLDERVGYRDPRAIAIRVLSGNGAGWQDSVSADWIGPWLGIPFGIAGALCLAVLASRNERPRPDAAKPDAEIQGLDISG